MGYARYHYLTWEKQRKLSSGVHNVTYNMYTKSEGSNEIACMCRHVRAFPAQAYQLSCVTCTFTKISLSPPDNATTCT